MKKYLVIGNFVTSKDGNRHFIGANQLMKLYRVKQQDCVILNFRDDKARCLTLDMMLDNFRAIKHLRVLTPISDGNYDVIATALERETFLNNPAVQFKLRAIAYLIKNKRIYGSYHGATYVRFRRYIFGGSKNYDKGFVEIINAIKQGKSFTQDEILSKIQPVNKRGRPSKTDYKKLATDLIDSGGVGL